MGTASAVSGDYAGESSVFTGTVNWVQIDLGEDAEDAEDAAPDHPGRAPAGRNGAPVGAGPVPPMG